MPELSYLEAIRTGLLAEMRQDASVYVFGEDVALGGPFGVTQGIAEELGAHRVVNTPISEGTVMGVAIGAALSGLRPVVEIMFVDFITLAMDQLVNHAAKLHYMSGGQLKVPLTVRVQCGVQGNMGAHHSQSLESWFLHVPGLKVVMPSNPADAPEPHEGRHPRRQPGSVRGAPGTLLLPRGGARGRGSACPWARRRCYDRART